MSMLDEYNPILTVDDICSILYVGKNTAYRLLDSSEISAFKIGRTWKIPKESVIRYILTCGGNISLPPN